VIPLASPVIEEHDRRVSGASTQRYCIIGAGPAGLAQARAFKLRGIEFDVIERHRRLGGLWDAENPGSPIYESAHFISSRSLSGFLGFPMPSSYPDYPRHDLILEYLRAFAEAYALDSHIQYGRSVERVTPTADGAVVRIEGRDENYAGVVCATGMNWAPSLPEYPGEFSGVYRHTASYRHGAELAGKRVLLIGLGNSGADIACDAARYARKAIVSVRRGYYFVPKHIFGKPADVFAQESVWLPKWLRLRLFGWIHRWIVGETRSLGMPVPDHRILEAHPLANDQLLHHLRHGDVSLKPDVERFEGRRVFFKDGSQIEVDEVLAATGYRVSLPYLDPSHVQWQGQRPSHFLSVFSRAHAGLFTLGFVELNGALYPHLDRLAALVAEYAHARAHAPESAARFRRIVESTRLDLTGGTHYVGSARHDFYCDDEALRRATLGVFRRAGWAPPNADAWRPAATAGPDGVNTARPSSRSR
jgi:cation diffusion facilitator CzcD-associated flavoprotein CzcO